MSGPPTSDASTGWSMGLRGYFAQIANLTAVALICVLFYTDRIEALRLAREDRVIFREAIERLSRQMESQANAIEELAASVNRLSGQVEEIRRGSSPKRERGEK